MDYQQVRRHLQRPRSRQLPLRRKQPRFAPREVSYPLPDPRTRDKLIQGPIADAIYDFKTAAIAVAISSALNLAWPLVLFCPDQFPEILGKDSVDRMQRLAAIEPDDGSKTNLWHDEAYVNGAQDVVWLLIGDFREIEEEEQNAYAGMCAELQNGLLHALTAIRMWNNGADVEDISYQLRAMAVALGEGMGYLNWYYFEDDTAIVPVVADRFIQTWFNEVFSRLAIRS